MEAILAKANVWIDKAVYDEAEKIYLERIANVSNELVLLQKFAWTL